LSYNEIFAEDAHVCRNVLEGYYQQKHKFPASAQKLVHFGCRSSGNVALFVLPKNNHYVEVSYHQGDKVHLAA